MDNKIIVRLYDKDGTFSSAFSTFGTTSGLAYAIQEGALDYNLVTAILGDIDIPLIYKKLGQDFLSDAIILHYDNETWPGHSNKVEIYKNMDTFEIMDTPESSAIFREFNFDNYPDNHPVFSIAFRNLVKIEGPFDSKRYFSKPRLFTHHGFYQCGDIDIDINYRAINIEQETDPMFSRSKFNRPIDRWPINDDRHPVDITRWFIESEFNQPLNNWEYNYSKLEGTFFRSKYNHPLDKWFSKPTTVNAIIAFAESECHQDLSMWRINPDSTCDGMFYNSKYTIEEVSTWPWVKELKQPVEDLFKLSNTTQYIYDDSLHISDNPIL